MTTTDPTAAVLARWREIAEQARQPFGQIIERYQSSAPWVAEGGETVYHGPSVVFYETAVNAFPALIRLAEAAARVPEPVQSLIGPVSGWRCLWCRKVGYGLADAVIPHAPDCPYLTLQTALAALVATGGTE